MTPQSTSAASPWVGLVSGPLALLLLLWSGPAGAVKVMVKGTTTLEGQVQADGDAQQIRGKLRDDLGAPVGGARVAIDVVQPDGKPLLTLPAPRPCGGGAAPQQTPDAYQVETDAQGAFCLRTQRLPQRGVLRLRFSGRTGLGTASFEIPFDADKPVPLLAWDPRPEVIDLDVPQVRVAAALVGAGSSGGSEALELTDEAGKVLATTVADERGRATFEVPTATLGGPGGGELTVKPKRAKSAVQPLKARVVRSARVNLLGTAPSEAVVPRDGYKFSLAADTQRGPADGGVVEARIGNEIVGVGSVKKGRVEVVTTFDVPTEGSIDVVFRYLSSSPEQRAGEGLVLRVPVKPPSPLRKAPLLVAGLLLVGWLARGWKRPPRAARAAAQAAGSGASPGQLPELVLEQDEGATGWKGVVLDAHEHRGIEGAVVKIVARDFYGEHEVGSAQTDRQGGFEIGGRWEPARVLVVAAPWHGSIERPLPKAGKLRLSLVSRRRALLERLVAAARRLGLESPSEGDPTPAQIARRLGEQERPGGERWARAVEEAAFGHQPVGASEEARVAAMEADLARREASDGVRR